MSIRLNVNAMITQGNKILLIKFNDVNGIHYNLPGGGVEVGESATEALKRECLEEAGVLVEVADFIGCWEYVPNLQNNKFGSQQKIGLIFKANLKNGQTPTMPAKPDPKQIGVEWVDLDDVLISSQKVDEEDSKENLANSGGVLKLFPEIAPFLIEAIQNKYKGFFTKEV